MIPLVLAGVLCLPTCPLSRMARTRVVLDGLLILVSLATFSWRYVLGPTLFGEQTGLLGRVIATAYPVGDLLLAFCLAMLLLRARARSMNGAIALLGAGLVALLAADSAFLYLSLHGGYVTGSVVDLGWPAFCLLTGMSANALSAVTVAQPGEIVSEGERTTVLRAVAPYLMVPLVGVLFFATVVRRTGFMGQEIGVLVGSTALVGLILLRQLVALVENVRLFQQTQSAAAHLQELNADLKATQAELVHSAKMASLGTLSAGVAHELNQPVAIARGISQQLLAEPDLPDYAREDLILIEAQTGRMMHIIQHLRSYCRTTGHATESAPLHRVLRDSFTLIAAQLKSRGIELRLEFDGEGPTVSINANEIEQVFLNLITNARDALEGRDGATLTIRSWIEGSQALVEFADNGPGVPVEALERIFDPFFTTKEVGKGTGLGLSISQNLVQKNGGTLTVRNETGAVFAVALPCKEEDAAPIARAA